MTTTQLLPVGEPTLMLGEVRTGLLRNSAPVTPTTAASLAALRPGTQVRSSTRPIPRILSADTATGVHCQLAAASGMRVEGVGTALTRAAITAGRVLQSSTRVLVTKSALDYRRPWSYYLALPGIVEVRGKARPADLTRGFMGARGGDVLDLGAISGRVLDQVQCSSELDRHGPLRAQRTSLKFAVRLSAEKTSDTPAELMIWNEDLRLFSFSTGPENTDSVVDLCEDVALHDWLLTTVLRAVESSEPGSITRLRPVIENLLHLWMPGAHVAEGLVPVWESLERRPGFSRQWDRLVSLIRDRMSLSVIGLLSMVPERDSGG